MNVITSHGHWTSIVRALVSSVHRLYRVLRGQRDFARMNVGPTKSHLNIILCNLMHAYFALRGSWVRYSRSPNHYKYVARYHLFGCSYAHTKGVIDALIESELIDWKPGFFYREDGQGKLSIIRANRALVDFLSYDVGLRPEDVAFQYHPELLVLRDYAKQPIDYKETSETTGLRYKLQRYNDCLNAHSIDLVGLGEAEKTLRGNYPVDMTRTTYHRVFSNGSFKMGGRFYGTWWQNLKSELRKFIQIDGKPTTGLDYSAIHIHLLYSLKEVCYADIFGDADPYTLDQENSTERNILKLALLVALNAENENKALWATKRKLRDLGENVPYDDLKVLLKRFAETHHRIQDQFYSGVGLSLQRLESQISERGIDYFTERGIPVLNVHDCFVCGIDHESILHDQMMDAFRALDLLSIPSIKKEF